MKIESEIHHTQKWDSAYLIIFFSSLILFSILLGNVHLFDWDEANFAEAAREMLLTDNWMQVQIDYQPFWEKPPLFIWLQALSMAVFGVNEFAARFPNAMIGAITLTTIFYIGHKVFNRKFAWLWVIVFAGSWLPHFYFKTGIIDPLFNLFIFLSVYQFWNGTKGSRNISYILSGLFLGLAVLTKGPAAILICGICLVIFLIFFKGYKTVKFSQILLLSVVAFITIFIWFGIDIVQNGWWFTQTFIEYQIRLLTTQDAGHGGPFYYHPLVLLIGCFPASIFLFQYTWNKSKRDLEFSNMNPQLGLWMQLLLWVTLILFSIVKTKIIHYSSLCYFPLTFFAARELTLYIYYGKQMKVITKVLLLIIGLLLAVAIVLLPILGMNIHSLQSIVSDPFTIANMNAYVDWHYGETFFGMLLLIFIIISTVMILKNKPKGVLILLLSNVLMIELVMIHFAPKIEEYSQGASIRYFKSIDPVSQAVYPGVYKSYAYLFYSGKLPEPNGSTKVTAQNIIDGKVDKELFFVTRNINMDELMRYHPQLELLKEENGYMFLTFPKYDSDTILNSDSFIPIQ